MIRFMERNELIAADVEFASRLKTANLLDADRLSSHVLGSPAKNLWPFLTTLQRLCRVVLGPNGVEISLSP
jgi:hypothetical protein